VKAEAICPRVDTRRSPQTVSDDISKIEHRIEQESLIRGNREEVETTYQQKLKAFNRINNEVDQISSFITVSLRRTLPLYSIHWFVL
jgi:hypothetical protein